MEISVDSMCQRNFLISIVKFRTCLLLLLFIPLKLQASFIESTIGTAVVNDATAAYFNPAALILLKNPQFIMLGSFGNLQTKFTGQSMQRLTGFSETGSSTSSSQYYLPSLYLALPTSKRITFGLTMMANSAFRDADETSLLRYAESGNSIEDYDLIPALEVKINQYLSLGTAVNFSYVNLLLKPITRFPGANIADSESNNQCTGSGVGGIVGFLLKPNPSLIIGFDYRSATQYQLSGKSVFNGAVQIVSNNYHFELNTPARSVLSISYLATPKLGFITTLQRIQWSVLNNIKVFGIATIGPNLQPLIINADIPFHWHDTWVETVGTNYAVTSNWIVRLAGSYVEAPGNPNYQVTSGDSFILGTSMGYNINNYITVDGSYAHAFIKHQPIDINGNRNLINGINAGARDAISLKLSFNIL